MRTTPNASPSLGALCARSASAVKRTRHAAIAALVLFIGGCGGTTPAKSSAVKPAAQSGISAPGSNILFVSVDTTRADHIACYGDADAHTPNIDRLAAEGVRFAMCITAIPLTLPSHSTMMTGSYPFVHGARDNGIYQLSPANQTLAEILSAQGYTTHAEVAAEVLGAQYGLNQGFQVYGDVETRYKERVKVRAQALAMDLEPKTTAVDLDDPDAERERPATDITDYGIEALKQGIAAGKPFFIFLHYFDPHWPFKAPEPFASEAKDDYSAEISYFDSQFGRLIDFLGGSAAADNTLVVLVSDHGEGRGQHGEYTHSAYLFDTTLHVPLILWAPGKLPAGVVVHEQVRTIDLAPTIMDFLKLPRTPQMEGKSLLTLLSDGAHKPRDAYSETMAAKNMSGYAMLRSLRTGEWKYILAPHPLLFQVDKDPMELYNVAEAEPKRVADMRDALRKLIADAPKPPGSRANRLTASEESLQALAALGYVTSSVAAEDDPMVQGTELDHFNPTGPDPHDHAEEIDCLSVGLGAYRQGAFDVAKFYLKRLIKLQPDHVMALAGLGGVYLAQDRPDDALPVLEHAVKLEPDSAEYQRMLGMAYAATGHGEQAEQAYLQAIQNDPAELRAHTLLGQLYASQHRTDDAMREYQAADKLSPGNPHVLLGYADIYRQQGDNKKAEEQLHDLLLTHPELTVARVRLAELMRADGRAAEAVAMLEQASAESPDDAGLHHALAVNYLRDKRVDQAIEQFRITAEKLEDNALAWYNLGSASLSTHHVDDAISALEKAHKLDDDYKPALLKLAEAYSTAGRNADAAQAYDQLAALTPEDPVAYLAAAHAHDADGDRAAAIASLRAARAAKVEDPRIANDLAWRLAASASDELRDGKEALELALEAVEATGRESYNELDTLALAYAENDQFDKAVETATHAEQIAREADPAAADRIKARIELYKQGRKYRDP